MLTSWIKRHPRLLLPEGHGTEVRTLSGCIFTVLSDLDFETYLQFERSSHCVLYPWINFFVCVISDKPEWSQIRPFTGARDPTK